MSVQISRSNKALIIPAGQWPYKTIGELPDGRLAVPHTAQNTRLLRALNIDAPNPMEEYYDWPGGPPFEVQRKSAQMLVENRRAYLLNQQGTGKTKTALWAWDFLNREGSAGKLLVVAKLSTLNFVWAREVDRTLIGRRVVVLGSDKGMSRPKRLSLLKEDADIYVINHDGILYEKDLGPDTAKIASEMKAYNPDKTWKRAPDSD